MLVASYQTPSDGAHLITAEEAAEALKNGKVTVESPEYTPTDVGEYYWVFSLTSPTKNLAGDGQPNKPQNDKDTSHLESEDFFTDRAHVTDETVQIIDATTKTKPLGHVGRSSTTPCSFKDACRKALRRTPPSTVRWTAMIPARMRRF